jgi:NhaP-type Na+/H+ or K+/H+ antiporter
MTYGAVLFTLLAQGLTIGPLVRRLGLQAGDAISSS